MNGEGGRCAEGRGRGTLRVSLRVKRGFVRGRCPAPTAARGSRVGVGEWSRVQLSFSAAGARRKSHSLKNLRNNLNPLALPLENKQTKSPGEFPCRGGRTGSLSIYLA